MLLDRIWKYFRDLGKKNKELAKLLRFSHCACIFGFDIAQGSLLELRISHQQNR